MQQSQMPKSYGNGFDHLESKETVRAFIAWWNEKSHFPFDATGENSDLASNFRMAA